MVETINNIQKYIDENKINDLQDMDFLKVFLSNGITISVQDMFEKQYHDMTIEQYAIAAGKPKVLWFLLKMLYKKCKKSIPNIMNPVDSNTKKNLFELAVEFSSDGQAECLEKIINFLKKHKDPDFTIDSENCIGETPLFVAIKKHKRKAIEHLLSNGANIFYKSKKNSSLPTPAEYLFIAAECLNDLDSFQLNLKGEKQQEFKKFYLRDGFKEFLTNINSQIGLTFLENQTGNDTQMIQTDYRKVEKNEEIDT